MPAHVFTYGSLMYPEVWSRVVAGRYAPEPAVIEGFRRHAIAGEHYPGVVREAGGSVQGVLWRDVDDDDLARLDAFEGPDYDRIEVPAHPVALPGQPARRAPPVAAGLYLYRLADRLLPRDWSVPEFEHHGLDRFIASYLRMP